MVQWRSVVISLLFLDRYRWMFARGSPSPLLTAWTDITKVWLAMHQSENVFLQSSLEAGESAGDASYFEEEYFTFIDRVYRYYRAAWNLSCCLVIIPLALCVLCGMIFEYIIKHLRPQPAWILAAIPVSIVTFFAVDCCLATILMFWYINQRQTRADPFDLRRILVNEIQIRKSTEARDKCFGIHAILSELGVMLSQSVEQVYTDLFVGLLRWTDSAALLMCNTGRKSSRPPGLCSWVPDWRVETKRNSMDAAYVLGTTDGWVQRTNQDSELGSRNFTFRSHDELVLHGKLITQISSCIGSFERTSTQYLDEEKPIYIKNLQVLQRLMSQLRSGKPFGSHLVLLQPLRSLEFDVSQRIHEVVPMQNFLQFSRILRWWQLQMEGILEPSADSVFDTFRSKLRYFTRLRYPPRMIDEYDHCISWINKRAEEERSFFFTSVDSLVYGPEIAMVGDAIMFVWGVPLPVVLRPIGDRYHLVRFAHVEGVDIKRFSRDIKQSELDEIVLF